MPSKVTRSLGQQVVTTGLQEVTTLTDMMLGSYKRWEKFRQTQQW